MSVIIERSCIWCNAKMSTKRADKKVFSQKCQNQMNYIHHRDYGTLSCEEFRELLQQRIDDQSHINPSHPLAKLDAALANFYQATTKVIELKQQGEQDNA